MIHTIRNLLAIWSIVQLASAASPTSTIAAIQESSVGQSVAVATSRSWAIKNSTQNQQVWPDMEYFRPEQQSVFSALYPNGSQLINVTCQDCSASGTVDVSIGGFETAGNGNITAYNWLKTGYIQYVLHGFEASLTTKIDVLPGFTNATIPIPLFGAPWQNWTLDSQGQNVLEGVSPVGYALSLKLNKTISFVSRISVEIPDGAYIYVNLSNPERSYVHGFGGAKISNNFDIGDDLPEFLYSQALITTWSGYLDRSSTYGSTETTGGLFGFDASLPFINSTFKSVRNVDSNCNPATDGKGVDHATRIDNSAAMYYSYYVEAEAIADDRNTTVLINLNDPRAEQAGYMSKIAALPDQNFSMPSLCYAGKSDSGVSKLTNGDNDNGGGGKSAGSSLSSPSWTVTAATLATYMLWFLIS